MSVYYLHNIGDKCPVNEEANKIKFNVLVCRFSADEITEFESDQGVFVRDSQFTRESQAIEKARELLASGYKRVRILRIEVSESHELIWKE